jgi:branched-chain amino acid transport system substrate-binding protein
MHHRAFTPRRITALLGAAALSAGLAACGSSDDSGSTGSSTAASTGGSSTTASSDPIIIGHAGSSTGFMKTFDDQVAIGLKVAADELNAKGGIDGRPVKIISVDSATDQAKSRTAAQQLLEQGADFIVPSCDYDIGGPAAQAASQKGVLSIGCAGGPLFGKQGLGDLVFNTYVGSPTHGATLATFANKQGWKTAFLVRDDSLAFTTSVCDNFDKEFTALGGKVLGTDTMQNTDTSFASQVSDIKAAKPDVVMLCSYPTGGVTALRAIRSALPDIPILGTGAYDGTYWVKSVPGISNFWISTAASRTGGNESQAQNDFFATVKKETGAEAPSALYTMSGYESLETIAKGVEKAGSTDGSKVAEALATFKDEPLLMGPTTYTADCHISIGRPEAVIAYENGKQKFLETLAAADVPDKTC